MRWADGCETALDVATGGGPRRAPAARGGPGRHQRRSGTGDAARRDLPRRGLAVREGAFDLVVTRIAPHHFDDVPAAVAEMARVSSDLVVVEDTLYVSEQVEEAEQLRDPTHVRAYSENEWRAFLETASLEIEQVESFEKRHPLSG